ncbi:MAG: hypothetical protein AAB947_01990 [Patescibacteria group bacterium]
MNIFDHVGEQSLPARSAQAGVSILGALVFALALGTTAVTGFELANAPPSSASLASSGSLAVTFRPGITTSPPPAKEATVSKCDFACNQAGDASEGDILNQECKPGFKYEIKEAGGKIQVKVKPLKEENKVERCPTSTSAAASLAVGPIAAGAKTKSCTDERQKVSVNVLPGDTGEVKYCIGVTVRASDPEAKAEVKGNCSKPTPCTGSESLGDLAKNLKNKSAAELLAGLTDDEKKQALAQLKPDAATKEGIARAIDELSGKAKTQIAENNAERKDLIAAIALCGKKGKCEYQGQPSNRAELKERDLELQKENAQLADQVKRLASAKKSLDATGGPPRRPGDPPPPDGPPPNGPPPPPPNGPPGGGGPPPGGGGGQPRGGGGGGQPRGGGGQPGGQQNPNTFPHQQQQCQTQLTCNGRDIYTQQVNCQQQSQPQLYQQCQFGCRQGSNTCNQQQQCSTQYICDDDAIYIQQTNCQQQSQQQPQREFYQKCEFGCQKGSNTCNQTQQCLPPPRQPDPSQCTSGTWKPKYGGQSGACMVGWECTPSGGPPPVPGTPTAQLSCEPKVADAGTEVFLKFSCSAGTSSGSGFNTNGVPSGTVPAVLSAPTGGVNTANFGLTCTHEGRVGSAQCSVQVGKPGIVLVANPKSVKSGKTSALGWVTAGIQSCVISSVPTEDGPRYGFKDTLQHIPAFTAENANNLSPNGVATTPPLTAVNNATSYYGFLLSCTTLGSGSKIATTSISAVQ